MSRNPRNYIKTSFFHVITQGINKSYIFNKPEDIKYYIKLMYTLKEEHDIKIIAYCIMNNHAHILIETQEIKELSKYMQRVNVRYGIYYNKKYNRVGYVFRDRFKSQGIYNEKQLYNCIKYIYDNPVKAGICKYASDYPYSNYKEVPENEDERCIFIDVEDDKEKSKEIIDEYLQKQHMNLIEIKKNKIKLKELVIRLHEDGNISLRKIANELEMKREKIRTIYNEFKMVK